MYGKKVAVNSDTVIILHYLFNFFNSALKIVQYVGCGLNSSLPCFHTSYRNEVSTTSNKFLQNLMLACTKHRLILSYTWL